MNASFRFRVLAVAALAAASPAVAGLPVMQPLGTALTGAPGCHHVLDLLLRYGPCEGMPQANVGAVIPSPYGSFVMPASEIGDLCIATIAESPASDPACAPTFVIGVTNSSCRSVCNVHVSLVALLGPIKPCDPTATACIEEIPAGATVEIEVAMPVECLTMGSNGGVAVGFQKLMVAIDAFDCLAEVDESNNLRLLCRADIPQQVVEVTTEVAAPVETAPAEALPAPEAAAPKSSLDSALEEFGIDSIENEAAAQRL